MGIKQYKPTSAGRRFQTVSDFAEITCTKPEKSLLAPLPKKAGRNNKGRITTRHQGGGVKRRYRIIDFKRNMTASPPRSLPSSTTRTVPPVSLFSITLMARSATSFTRRA